MSLKTDYQSLWEKLPVNISDVQFEKLEKLMNAVLEMNQRLNLTRMTNPDDFITGHLYDSLAVSMPKGETVLDVGTGGGFPGLPLAVCYPERRFTLLDATAKKIEAVKQIADTAEIHNVDFLVGRAEALSREEKYRESFDIVTSRAVAAYGVLSELCLPFVRTGGYFLAWKGPGAQDEIIESGKAATILGGKQPEIKDKNVLKNHGVHVIIFCEKKHETPKKYPRSFGQIKKKPLK